MRKLIVTSMVVAVLVGTASAADFGWTGPNQGDWSTVANWYNLTAGAPATRLPGYPTENNDWVVIDPGVGIGPALNVWEHNTYGILTRNGDITVRNTAYIGCKAQFYIAYDAGNVSEVTVEPGGTLTLGWNSGSGGRGSFIGNNGTGKLHSWGEMYSNAEVYIGTQVGSVGVVNLHDGALWHINKAGQKIFYVGTHGDGTLNIDGGKIDAGGTRLDIGNYNSGAYTTSRGHIEMSGGQIVAKHLYMEINALTLQAGGPVDVRGTIHQTGGEFLFVDTNQTLALSRVNQAINLGWWTTDPGLELSVWQDVAGTHVTVIPEPATLALLGLGGLLLHRRRA